MTVGIVGLGLIGGSFAKAYSKSGARVLAFDTDETVLGFSVLSGVTAGVLTRDSLAECDLLLIATYPRAAEEYLEAEAPFIGKNTLVMDCLGVKRAICAKGFALAEKYGFTFVGGHPMAGTHNSGFKYSRESLFSGAPMVIVPPKYDDIELLERVKALLAPAGFGSVSVTDAERHDRIIAFTSQLAHVVSNAYIKSPAALDHRGFSAGSYKDLTRVAWLQPDMWTELFLANGDNLVGELDFLIRRLGEYRDAISDGNAPHLRRLLDEGRMRKKEIDGR